MRQTWESYTPGEGCKCAQCLRPLPPIINPVEQSAERRTFWELHRKVYREAYPIVPVTDGGTKVMKS